MFPAPTPPPQNNEKSGRDHPGVFSRDRLTKQDEAFTNDTVQVARKERGPVSELQTRFSRR